MPQHMPEDSEMTQMIIPVSKGTYFNTNWKPKQAPLGAYDMLYHPPDYNPKSARSDRQEPKIIRQNIWDQVPRKRPGTAQNFTKVYHPRITFNTEDVRFVRIVVKNQNPHMRIHNVLEWAQLINEGKPDLCD